MKGFAPFDVAETPLVPGVTLIEASAGTGKTYTIAGIFLRLVLEDHVPIARILAVTFTNAATAELRDRVRRRLHDAHEDLRRGESDDAITQKALASGDVRGAIRELNVAVQSFDEAQIFTMHGFCQRVLRENAFESGLLFDMELLADPGAIFEEIAHDFWRSQFYHCSPLLARLALSAGRSLGDWIALLQRMRNHPDLAIIPPPGEICCEELLGKIEESFAKIMAEWKTSGDRVGRLLRDDKSLSRDKKNSHFSQEGVEQIVAAFEELTADLSSATPASLSALTKLATSEVAGCTKKTGTAPTSPLFDLCEEFKGLSSLYFHQLTHDFIAFARRELPVRKERLNVLTYDDLTTQLRDALAGPGGEAFTAVIGGKYHAALLDEFQDTDPAQYEIFRRLFAGGAHHLVYIGDPKQAIYGFRGADVFTYLRAADGAAKFTLRTNFRSEAALLDGTNALFANVSQPFLIPQIAHLPVSAPKVPKKSFVALQEVEAEPPLRFRWLEENHHQSDAEDAISDAVVEDIVRVKASGARLGERPLAYGDMAVLVRSNAQAANLQNLLRARGIKSVLQTEASVFHTLEASELLRLLKGVTTPNHTSSLKTALATRLIGSTATELVGLEQDEPAWQRCLTEFIGYRTLWESSGFIAVFRQILIKRQVRERLVLLPGGERALTNFLHLAELLHQAERERRLTPGGLCAWLLERRFSEMGSSEEDQLRLESDEDGVQLTTIHKSKGLEYPVVFCPFLWKAGDGSKRSEIIFHDPSEKDRLTLDLRDKSAAPDNDEKTGEERLAESLRVLYVAVTRAQNRCYIYAGNISNFDNSPLAYLLGSTEAAQALHALAAKAPDAIAVTTIGVPSTFTPEEGSEAREDEALSCRTFHGTIPQVQMIASFTGLTSGKSEEAPDRDAVAMPEDALEEDGELAELAEFERGVRAGVFMHDVLENLDFTAPESIDALVSAKLIAHGMHEPKIGEGFARQVRKLLDAELAPGVNLSRVTPEARLNEVQFTHPVADLRPAHLKRVFEQSRDLSNLPDALPERLGRMQFNPVKGYMRGVMDCLFLFDGRYYLIDWKSNWFGNRLADYDEAGMRACMSQHLYFLQYHLYTVAADLYLRRRLAGYDYETHFGGVFYVFVRGIDSAVPGRGIFKDKPDGRLVEALKKELIGA